jgi:hypothetical protein
VATEPKRWRCKDCCQGSSSVMTHCGPVGFIRSARGTGSQRPMPHLPGAIVNVLPRDRRKSASSSGRKGALASTFSLRCSHTGVSSLTTNGGFRHANRTRVTVGARLGRLPQCWPWPRSTFLTVGWCHRRGSAADVAHQSLRSHCKWSACHTEKDMPVAAGSYTHRHSHLVGIAFTCQWEEK